MRLIPLLFLFISCSHSLKYKYSFSKKYLASLTSEETQVKRIELELKEPQTFASGMDSNFLQVRLFDEEGHQLTNVDPTDLTISTSEDIEAKPFALKQGVYKAEILPYIRSRSISMQVDWQNKVVSPMISLVTSVAPFKNDLEPANRDFTLTHSLEEINVRSGSRAPSSSTDGFNFENLGDNKIVNTKKYPYISRHYAFEYPDQARQNISLEVTDVTASSDSQTMLSIFMMFPRKNLPLVEQLTGTIDVTLPTGEKMIFSKESKEIVGGIFEEGPLDVSANKLTRKYPDIKYRGKGVILRANARGQSPQLGQYEKDQIDMEYGLKGSVDVLIINGSTGQRCRRPKADFWEPLDVSPIEFKFPTDEEFNQYLKSKCGFELPKL